MNVHAASFFNRLRQLVYRYHRLIIAVLIIAGLVGLFMGFVQLTYVYARSHIAPPAEQFIWEAEKQHYTQLYEHGISPLWKDEMAEDDFVNMLTIMRKITGPLHSLIYQYTDRSQEKNSIQSAIVYLSAEYENGPVFLQVVTVFKDHAWQVAGIHYQSPLIREKMTCPHCHTFNDTFTTTCKKCHAPLFETEDSQESTLQHTEKTENSVDAD